MFEDGIVGIAFVAHDRRAYLAQSHAMSPSGSNKMESRRNMIVVGIILVNDECRACRDGSR